MEAFHSNLELHLVKHKRWKWASVMRSKIFYFKSIFISMILIHNEQQLKKEVRQWYLAVRFSLGYKTKQSKMIPE